MSKFTRYLRVTFTDEQLAQKSRQLSMACNQLSRTKLEKTAVVAQFKERTDRYNAEIDKLARETEAGWIMEDVECRQEMNSPHPGVKSIYRLDTGDKVEELVMTEDERQIELFPNNGQIQKAMDEDGPPTDESTKNITEFFKDKTETETLEAAAQLTPELAERALLGQIMLNAEHLWECNKLMVLIEEFKDSRNASIYRAMKELTEGKQLDYIVATNALNPLTICQQLEKTLFEFPDMGPYVAALTEGVTPMSSIRIYVAIMHEKMEEAVPDSSEDTSGTNHPDVIDDTKEEEISERDYEEGEPGLENEEEETNPDLPERPQSANGFDPPAKKKAAKKTAKKKAPKRKR